MSNIDIDVSVGSLSRPPSFRHHVMDFANMLKAFIGANYLTIAFAFRQSGIHLGWIGLVIVANVTAHCCHLIVKCKYHAIRHVLEKVQVSCSAQRDGNLRDNCDKLQSYSSGDSSDEGLDEQNSLFKKMQRNMTYGDIGHLCMGKVGLTLVNASVMFTQFGFCLGYFIFVGNTLQSIFPLYNCSLPVSNASGPTVFGDAQQCIVVKHLNSLQSLDIDMAHLTEVHPGVLHSKTLVNQRSLALSRNLSVTADPSSVENFINFLSTGNISTVAAPKWISSAKTPTAAPDAKNITTIWTREALSTSAPAVTLAATTNTSTTPPATNTSTTPPTTNTSMTPPTTSGLTTETTASSASTTSAALNTTHITPLVNTTRLPWFNVTQWILTRGKHVPNLKLLVLMPLGIFIAMTFIRSIRHLGIISAIANAAIFVGCIEVLVFLIVEFEISSSYVLFNFHDLPIFFGMVTGAFEGIGTMLPIEASMEGNRHNFAKFLYGAVAVLTVVLASFGTLGYLRFGNGIEQMINANIPNGSILSIAVNVCLIIGVLLTFPLMIYPVVELAELFLFGNGRLCGPSVEKDKGSDHESLLPKEEASTVLPVPQKVSNSVATWKRNLLRIFIVACACGLAVLLRNSYAYIAAFVGALGSSLLAFILPCLFHLRLCWSELPCYIKFKDIAIIIIGIACSAAGVYAVMIEIINNVKD